MPKLPVVSGKDTVQALKRAGFSVVDQEGSHVKLRKRSNGQALTAIVPLHRELARRTLRSVLKQAELSVEEFKRLL